ncbi:MAG: phosphotransferase family protein [Acidimicrobiales bacterium]
MSWIDKSRALAAIHTTAIASPPSVLLRPPFSSTFAPQRAMPAGIPLALERVAAIAPAEQVVFSHADFHPGNVIVGSELGAVVGVIDWSNARMAPRGFDVGLARSDLAINPGGDAPDRFLEAYESASGLAVGHLGLWDALAAARVLWPASVQNRGSDRRELAPADQHVGTSRRGWVVAGGEPALG